MKLVVGLGNPGKEYDETRHNLGFEIIDYIVKKNDLGNFQSKFNGLYLKTKTNNKTIIYLKPQLYMNLSGEVIKKYLNFFKIDLSDLIVIHDDLDLDLGKIKIVKNRGSAGHNGVDNINNHLQSKDYVRLRLGISKGKGKGKEYVLSKLTKKEKTVLEEIKPLVEKVVSDLIDQGFNINAEKNNKKPI